MVAAAVAAAGAVVGVEVKHNPEMHNPEMHKPDTHKAATTGAETSEGPNAPIAVVSAARRVADGGAAATPTVDAAANARAMKRDAPRSPLSRRVPPPSPPAPSCRRPTSKRPPARSESIASTRSRKRRSLTRCQVATV